jgi:hypothetical protein
MYKECRHIKPNGCKCKSPALKDKPYCYYHIRVHGIARNPNSLAPYEHKDLQIPFLEDRGAVQIALSEVVSALAGHRIEFKRAALMIYALQVASSNAKVPADLVTLEQVRDSAENEAGEELAPEVTTYEPGDDEYQDANHEPGLADILLAEIHRHRNEHEAKELAEAQSDQAREAQEWSGDPWKHREYLPPAP